MADAGASVWIPALMGAVGGGVYGAKNKNVGVIPGMLGGALGGYAGGAMLGAGAGAAAPAGTTMGSGITAATTTGVGTMADYGMPATVGAAVGNSATQYPSILGAMGEGINSTGGSLSTNPTMAAAGAKKSSLLGSTLKAYQTYNKLAGQGQRPQEGDKTVIQDTPRQPISPIPQISSLTPEQRQRMWIAMTMQQNPGMGMNSLSSTLLGG